MLKNNFSALGQLTTAEGRWQMMKESMLESAKEHIPVTKRKEDIDDPRSFRLNGREKKKQSRRIEIERTRQTRGKEM